jgi:hypothetical protein
VIRYQAIKGASLLVIAKFLGQTSVRSAEIYAHLNLGPVLDSMQATKAMRNAGGPFPTAAVTPIEDGETKQNRPVR